MCVIIYKPKGVILEPELLVNAWNENPDGAGFSYWCTANRWITLKGLMEFEDFFSSYSPHQEKELVIHFRIATHGVVNEKNTHPFQDEERDPILYHNGVIGHFGSDKASDTAEFYHSVLKHVPSSLARVKLLQSLTHHGKFALLEPTGAIRLVGTFHELGEGIQASNLSLYYYDEFNEELTEEEMRAGLMPFDIDEWEEEQIRRANELGEA